MKDETIVFVHGLWMNGMDMSLLRQRFTHLDYQTCQFRYNSLTQGPQHVAKKLAYFVETIPTPSIHFICHSLGGLIIRHLFHDFPDQKPGRVVTLGTPHQSSAAAKRLSAFHAGQVLLGHSIDHGLLGKVPAWDNDHDLGVIAGTLRMGFGLFIPGIPRPNDGTVAVKETRLVNMKDHIELPVSHFGMLLSGKVFKQSAHFIANGRFVH